MSKRNFDETSDNNESTAPQSASGTKRPCVESEAPVQQQLQDRTAPTTVAMPTAVTEAQLSALGTPALSATVLIVTDTPSAQASTITAATALTPVQLAQRISAATTLSSGVQQQLQGKTLTHQQFQILQQQLQQQQTLLRQKAALQQQQQQQQQLSMQKLTLPDLRHPQLRQLKGSVIQGQKTVITKQLVTSMAQGGQLKATAATPQLTRPLTQEEFNRLKQQQLTQQKVAGTSPAQLHHSQLQGAQIIGVNPIQQASQAPSTVIGQPATKAQAGTPQAGSATIPVSLPQKGGVAKVSQINPQQMHLLQQRKQALPVQKSIGQKAPQMLNAVQIIQQQGRGLTVQQLHQLVKQQSQGGTIQQIIHTSQPTIIATVTQSQATPQMVTNVIPTTATVQQTIQGATQIVGSSATVTTVPVPSSLISSLPQGQSQSQPATPSLPQTPTQSPQSQDETGSYELRK